MEMESQVTNLVTALEKATLMAKQLQSTTTATDSANIYASLHAARRHLSIFLAQNAQPQPSADVIDDDDASMQIADEEQQVVDEAKEEDSKMTTIETVEERMKNCFIQNNKRRKRSLSPTSLAGGERRRWLEYEIQAARAEFDYDPHLSKLRALDLIYQFHC